MENQTHHGARNVGENYFRFLKHKGGTYGNSRKSFNYA
jgi:hypothetical protein